VNTTVSSNATLSHYSLVPVDSIGTDVVDPATTDAAYLTPDALMAYCESRLRSIDGQIQSGMDKQNTNNAEQQLIGELNTTLQGYAANGTTQPGSSANAKNDGQCVQIEQKFDEVIARIRTMDPNSPLISQLEKIHDNIMATGTQVPGMQGFYGTPDGAVSSDGQINAQEIGTFINDLQGVSSSVNSSSELEMIQLQSFMSQRQTAIQLTTNLVQSLGDQLNKIADNIGH